MRATDQMLGSYVAEIEERGAFIDALVSDPQGENGDLSDEQLELVQKAQKRIETCDRMMKPLEETRRIGVESAQRVADISRFLASAPPVPQQVEYRSAGEYLWDYWQGGLGDQPAKARLESFDRAASHQTTTNSTGLLPAPIIGPVLNFIDSARPLVSALGPRQLPGTGFSRPKVTVHTAVAAQTAEKAELTSQAMTITKLVVSPVTLGGYVNISKQSADWSQPSVLDMVISDLAAEYAISTEAHAAQAFYTGSTASAGTAIPATPTAANVAQAFWTAAAEVYNGTKGQGRTIAVASPDVLGIIGPLFAPVNPVTAQSEGFYAASYGLGAMGSIGGIPVYITSGFAAAKSLVVMSTAAAEVYEDRIGSLQVVEPSVLGIQVAYAGYWAELITQATGIIKITVT